MKQGGFQNKQRKPLKRSALKARVGLRRSKVPLKRTRLRVVGTSPTAQLKREIQRLVREIVIARDGGCILRNIRHCDPDAVLQADHLITRSNSATYADTRLIVCLCKPCHGGYKKWHKEKYDVLVKTVISKERVKLWDDSSALQHIPKRVGAYDWKLAIVALEQELENL